MSRRHIVIASIIATLAACTGCGQADGPAAQPSNPPPTTAVAPRPMTDWLVGNAETPAITYIIPAAAAAIALGTIGMPSGTKSPECDARNASMRLIGDNPFEGALARVATADGKPRYDVQIAVLNRVIDTTALSNAMRGCPELNMSTNRADGTIEQTTLEIPATREVPDVGPVVEIHLIREMGSRAAGSMPTAGVARFVTVGTKTVVEFVNALSMSADVPAADSIALGDHVLAAQVKKLR